MALRNEAPRSSTDDISKMPSHSEYAKQLFDSGLFSDCTVYAGTRTWHLHRAILAQRCRFFRACFSNGFRESRYDYQVGSAEVSMHDDNPIALGRVLEWLYTLEYPLIEEGYGNEGKAMDEQDQQIMPVPAFIHSKFWTSELALLVVADKYDLTDLVNQASTSICSTAAQCSWKATDTDDGNFSGSIEDFVDMLELLYMDISSGSTAARNLQKELLNCSAMMIASQALRHSRLSQLVTGVPELAKDLVEALRQTIEAQQTDKTGGTKRSSVSSSHSRTGRFSRASAPWNVYRSESESSGGGRSPGRTASRTSTTVKPHIPMNEDSDLE